MEGIPIALSDQNTKKPGVIFVLEKASLEVAKVGKSYQILNSDDHANFLRRNNKNPADYRPDIVHQALLSILDSPLTKAGRLRAVYVKTEKGVLFEVKPHVRLPRTYKRFAGIMLQLLQKLSITAVGKREKLLCVIKNPVTQYLPVNSRKIGFSFSSEKLVKMRNYVATVNNEVDLVFVVGAMAHGKIDTDYTDDYIASSTLGTYKINSDASLFAKTDIPAELPEAMGIQIGPSMAKDARLSPMVVECDAQVLVQLQANKAAHALAKHALSLDDVTY
ncbi:hypothetical protein JRO89_XS11G0058000 [Xanthoceras sorbifolium]|uniref:Ribosomal RNA small subunit methyltransferase NEP1 n=1 Tax=Xanthoceras sorbifolium TaxID=99658 RepID=A0ABQ8HES9_9ROSI|nr:hypothetical protein JRO89_XS11G0058000 [Xanthoceras sorbifolium]